MEKFKKKNHNFLLCVSILLPSSFIIFTIIALNWKECEHLSTGDTVYIFADKKWSGFQISKEKAVWLKER